ncbi:uncharacterized protein LOC101862815 [Aplysia californica]|uniref:Uncharacterized protein LOC101862815 n=1 Tax=Aplysia californica TaxID=6500 RepID=A0ABM0JX55_APLCA|nr:uncharacterized protein LOC101862815 [Aplysia californica]
MASNGIDVYVKMPSGRSAQYDVRNTLKISGLCELVAKDEGVDACRVRLKYQGKTLDGNKTVGQYGVRVETILKAEILVPKNVDLVVELLDERWSKEIVISNLEPVSALFDIISEELDEERNKLQLQIAGKNLPFSSSSLMEVGVIGGSTITVSKKVEEEPVTKNASNAVLDSTARQEILSSFDAHGRNVEVVFSFDTTGSMFQYLTEVRRKLKECCRQLLQQIPNIRIGIIAHGDYCDSSVYVIKQKDLTSDLETLIDFTSTVGTTTGGDSPECYEWVLRKAQQLDWAEDSAKALVVIGDLFPHPPSYTDQNISWREELDLLSGMGVKVYGVQAGRNNDAVNFYKELADVSHGCYVNLTHIDVITDMFLAVCYRESDDGMLENFEEEVASKGEMTEAKKEMFSQLKQKQKEPQSDSKSKAKENKRYVNAPWWDLSKDNGSPQYCYNSNEDKWTPYEQLQSTVSNPVERKSAGSRSSGRRKKGRCAVM